MEENIKKKKYQVKANTIMLRVPSLEHLDTLQILQGTRCPGLHQMARPAKTLSYSEENAAKTAIPGIKPSKMRKLAIIIDLVRESSSTHKKDGKMCLAINNEIVLALQPPCRIKGNGRFEVIKHKCEQMLADTVVITKAHCRPRQQK